MPLALEKSVGVQREAYSLNHRPVEGEQDLLGKYMDPKRYDPCADCDSCSTCNNCGSGDCNSCCGSSDD